MLTHQAAKELFLCDRSVRYLVQQGKLRGAKLGRDLNIDPKSVREYKQKMDDMAAKGVKKRGVRRSDPVGGG
jgi:orotate phosphoribosyltransferase-like protein